MIILFREIFYPIKFKKYQSVDKYIEVIKNTDTTKFPPLSVGDIKDLKETDYNNLFSYIDDYKIIKEKYCLDNYTKGQADFEKALSLMQWLTDSTYYFGMQYKLISDNTLDILEYAYKKPFKNAINCRCKAIAFADILLACGIKAYPVALIGDKNYEGFGCHLVVHAYLSDKDKWVIFDPSFNTYFTDFDNNSLNAFELRKLFLDGKEPVIHGYNFNGTQECMEIYKEVFIKSCLTNITTWHDNSVNNRNGKNLNKRKSFDYKLPESNSI